MVGIEEGAAVEQDEVLVNRAAADVEAGGSFADGLYARQGQDGLDQVALAESGGDLLDPFELDALQAKAGAPVVGDAFRRDGGRLEGGDLFFHVEVQAPVFIDDDFQGRFFHGIATEGQGIASGRKLHSPISVDIGSGIASVLVRYRDAGDGFAVGDVADLAMDGGHAGAGPALVADFIDFVEISRRQGLLF